MNLLTEREYQLRRLHANIKQQIYEIQNGTIQEVNQVSLQNTVRKHHLTYSNLLD